jgi:NAD+ kinase
MPDKRVALVVKRSAWERAREHPEDRLHELLERGDPTVAHVRAAHAEHEATVAEVKRALAECGASVTQIRTKRDHFNGGRFDLVVTVGGDGTLLHASHSVKDTPILGINSSPSTSVGFFSGARSGKVAHAIAAALDGELKRVELTRMQVTANGKTISRRVLNDALFCHQSPAATSRYIIEHRGRIEEQKSSGFWVGPAAGSTAAQCSAGGKVLPLGSSNLQLVVREPYIPHERPYRMQRIVVKPGEELLVRSKSRRMRLYMDGPDEWVAIDIGDVLTFTQSPEPLVLLGISPRR